MLLLVTSPPDRTTSLLPTDRITIVPHSQQEVYVNWQIAPEEKAILKAQGGEKIVLKIYQTEDSKLSTNIWQQEVGEQEHDRTLAVPHSNAHYIAEIGYLTAANEWLSLAKSVPVHVPTV